MASSQQKDNNPQVFLVHQELQQVASQTSRVRAWGRQRHTCLGRQQAHPTNVSPSIGMAQVSQAMARSSAPPAA
jgi:coenzyme F420-reducing hydrogenase alpha subunit